MKEKNIRRRLIKDRLFLILIGVLSLTALIPLIFILGYIFRNGIRVINWDFLTQLPQPVGEETAGGIVHALVGTIIIIGLSFFLAVPFGIGTGVYLSENRNTRFSVIVRLCVDLLMGVPSIVVGIIAYAWIVRFQGFSALAGSIALSILMIPMVVRGTEETLNLIPPSYKEASLALGVPYYRTMLKVIIPSGFGGITTGVLLALARIAGETAPLLFTALGSNFLNVNIFKPMHTLPLLIYDYATSPYKEWHHIAWGASFVLVIFVLVLNIISRLVIKKWKIQF